MEKVEKQFTPEQERFMEAGHVLDLADEFCVPKPVRDRISAVLMEALDRPEDFWRVARMLRRRIVRRNVVVNQRWAENALEVA